jgi:predicted RNase H-like HicB family nuclease
LASQGDGREARENVEEALEVYFETPVPATNEAADHRSVALAA